MKPLSNQKKHKFISEQQYLPTKEIIHGPRFLRQSVHHRYHQHIYLRRLFLQNFCRLEKCLLVSKSKSSVYPMPLSADLRNLLEWISFSQTLVLSIIVFGSILFCQTLWKYMWIANRAIKLYLTCEYTVKYLIINIFTYNIISFIRSSPTFGYQKFSISVHLLGILPPALALERVNLILLNSSSPIILSLVVNMVLVCMQSNKEGLLSCYSIYKVF